VVEDLVVRIAPTMVRMFVFVAAPLVLGCTGEARSASPQQAGSPMGGAVAKAEFVVDTSTEQLPLELPAQLYAEHDAVVVARSAGTIDSIFAELGDRVRAGQLLARLESGEQELALASAEAAHDNLVRTAARARELARSRSLAPSDSEQVELQLRQAAIARREAVRHVALTRIVAPFAGVVTGRVARPSRFVAVGDTLFRVTEAAPLFARVHVPEASGRVLRVGESATAIGTASDSYAATIVHTAPFVDAASGTREVILEVRTRGVLPAGSSVTMRVGHEPRRVTSVPREAVAPEGFALVVENGRSTLRPVTLGRAIGRGRVEVLSGLSPGERLARPVR
jgi:RND family efflux transporter MFP subunit